jgi:hypothetical protein
MLVEELRDQPFIDSAPPTGPGVCPLGEVRDTQQVSSDRLCSVPALAQVLFERSNVWPDPPVGETAYVSTVGAANDVHGDLQKWDHHCITGRNYVQILACSPCQSLVMHGSPP